MKQIILPLILLLMFSAGCRRSTTSSDSSWPPVDREFDSIAAVIEQCRWKMDGNINSHLSALQQAYRQSPRKDALQGRMLFWKGATLRWTRQDPDSARDCIERAIALTDSSNHPYDYARFKFGLIPFLTSDLILRYKIIRETREVFHRYADSAMTAMADVELGNLLEFIGLSHLAIENYDSALRKFEASGFDYIIPRVKMNKAISLANIGQKKEAGEILTPLMTDSAMTENLALQHLVLMNNYLVLGDTALLKEAYHISCSFPFLSSTRVFESVELGKFFLNTNQLDSATFYINQAYDCIGQLHEIEDKKYVLEAVLSLLAVQNRDNPFSEVFTHYKQAADSVEEMMLQNNIVNAETRYKIKIIEQHEALKREKQTRTIWILSLCSVVILLGGISLFLRYKNKLLKDKHAIELRLQKNRETFAAFKLHQNKTLEILEEFETAIDSNRNDPGHTGKIMNWLSQQIKIQKAKSKEWDCLLETFNQIHPDFEIKMNAAYPGLTKKQIEFAGYIALGMSTKQIAEILSIDIASVNTNRYRLRSRMGLLKNQSLEEALMAICTPK